ncbi:hypothetical protein CDL12_21927 [Handroanthus impetiginosus]|uniref:Uncharacterized protein n=1 Tax=Handroanthus impetiginosus TaxID=429701 RepID=A0A2G9GJP7_9LAMI|nr:hypothetical protein CDL12_21927 [Handroanthus impetiginosus]
MRRRRLALVQMDFSNGCFTMVKVIRRKRCCLKLRKIMRRKDFSRSCSRTNLRTRRMGVTRMMMWKECQRAQKLMIKKGSSNKFLKKNLMTKKTQQAGMMKTGRCMQMVKKLSLQISRCSVDCFVFIQKIPKIQWPMATAMIAMCLKAVLEQRISSGSCSKMMTDPLRILNSIVPKRAK